MKKILSIILIMLIALTFTISASATTINQEQEIETMAREIPEGAVLIQTGLYLHEYTRTIGGTVYTFRQLYSADGYCFYDNEAEIYDNEGNLVAPEDVTPEMRVYSQNMSLAIQCSSWTYEQLNARYISVPIQEGWEIVSVGNDHETM